MMRRSKRHAMAQWQSAGTALAGPLHTLATWVGAVV
jgi:hypothetical protein